MDINPLLSLCGIGPFSTNEVLSPKLFIFHGFVNNNGHSLTLTNYARLLTIHGNVPSCYHYDFWIPDNFIVKLQKIYDMNTSDTPFDEIKIPDIYIIEDRKSTRLNSSHGYIS